MSITNWVKSNTPNSLWHYAESRSAKDPPGIYYVPSCGANLSSALGRHITNDPPPDDQLCKQSRGLRFWKEEGWEPPTS